MERVTLNWDLRPTFDNIRSIELFSRLEYDKVPIGTVGEGDQRE